MDVDKKSQLGENGKNAIINVQNYFRIYHSYMKVTNLKLIKIILLKYFIHWHQFPSFPGKMSVHRFLICGF